MYIPGIPNITIPDLSWYEEIGIIFIFMDSFMRILREEKKDSYHLEHFLSLRANRISYRFYMN